MAKKKKGKPTTRVLRFRGSDFVRSGKHKGKLSRKGGNRFFKALFG